MSEPYPTHQDNRQELDPRNIRLSDSARDLLIQFHNHIERELAIDGQYANIRSFANKSTEHASRIAAVLSIVDATIPLDQVVIEDEMIARAIILTVWYLDEWLSIQSTSKIPEDNRLALLLKNWATSGKNPHRSASGTALVYRSQLGKNAPNSIRKKQIYEKALATLIDHGFCRLATPMILDGALREEVFEIKAS
jgi:putative DNA primase/helicase